MPAICSSFDNDLAYDQEGHVIIKSTCRKCGASELVCVRDGSLAKWQSQHECSPTPEIPITELDAHEGHTAWTILLTDSSSTTQKIRGANRSGNLADLPLATSPMRHFVCSIECTRMALSRCGKHGT